MNEQRTCVIYAEKRSFLPDEARDELIWVERRVFEVQEEDRALEVLLP